MLITQISCLNGARHAEMQCFRAWSDTRKNHYSGPHHTHAITFCLKKAFTSQHTCIGMTPTPFQLIFSYASVKNNCLSHPWFVCITWSLPPPPTGQQVEGRRVAERRQAAGRRRCEDRATAREQRMTARCDGNGGAAAAARQQEGGTTGGVRARAAT